MLSSAANLPRGSRRVLFQADSLGGYVVYTHPKPWTNPVTFRASAALPAVGAWDVNPTEIFCTGADTVMLSFTYTRGAAGGAILTAELLRSEGYLP